MGAKRGATWRLNPLAFGNTIFSHRPLSAANTTLLYNLPRSGAPFLQSGIHPVCCLPPYFITPSEPARSVGGTLDAQGRRPDGGLNLGAEGA